MKKAKVNKIVIGKIYSVACKDFITYNNVTMYPGQHLNLIIGPNGTGKSTLVAAIILGLGGHPKLLSRSTNINHYVKNGKQSAWIQIKIYKSPMEDLVTFERTFGLSEKPTFKVDNKEMSAEAYKREIKKFNIQIDNLCQFLPQDRVQDFAKLNQQELLESTQRSVCSEETVETFQKLKEIRNNQKKSKTEMADNIKLLQENQGKLEEMETAVEQMNLRQKLLNDIAMCEKKKNWLECDKAANKVIEMEKDLERATTIYERHKSEFIKIDKETKSFEKHQSELTAKIQAEAKKGEECTRCFENLNKTCENTVAAIKRAGIEFNSKKNDIQERETELANAERLLKAAQSDLANARETCGSEQERRDALQDFQERLDANREEIRKLGDKYREINRTLDEDFQGELSSLQRKINNLENIDDRKLNHLRTRWPDVFTAVQWVRQNRHLFDDLVFEPMIMALKIKDSAKNAKYIENIVSINDLTALTCVSKDDMSLLVRKLCTEMKLKISIVHSPASDHCRYKPTVPIEDLKHLGFNSYLLDLIDGPAPVLNNLCRYYRIFDVAIGDERVNRCTDRVPKHIRVYFANNLRYQITTSKYTDDVSSLRQEISGRNLMGDSVDTELLNNLKRRHYECTKKSDALKNQRTDVEGKIKEKEEIQRRINNEKREYDSKSFKVHEYRQKCKQLQQKVENIKSKQIDIEQEERNFKHICKEAAKKRLNATRQKVDLLAVYEAALSQYNYLRLEVKMYKLENVDLENKKNTALKEYENSKKVVDNIKLLLVEEQKNLKTKENKAKANCAGKHINDHDFPYSKKFRKLPNDLDAMFEHIDKLQSRVECIGSENKELMEEYHRIKKIVDDLKEAVEVASQNNNDTEQQISNLYNSWITEIQNIIEVINNHFSSFMKNMNYAGEVKLHWTDEKDYNTYGIQILVKYRDESKLQILDRYTQSGGERAVAIAVYTLSIQHISHVPFRCVDEINQGMDPRNERKIFEMLVQQTACPGKSQYFFVTPKLLPNLTSNEYMDVHIVYNGKIAESVKFYPFEV